MTSQIKGFRCKEVEKLSDVWLKELTTSVSIKLYDTKSGIGRDNPVKTEKGPLTTFQPEIRGQLYTEHGNPIWLNFSRLLPLNTLLNHLDHSIIRRTQ
ncbi:hypothetical protein KQX54_016382 [Cotesia glomerata]|uniref:Uncharacterized protein n=1 Tax=Cotesia glomerata TaxID=32391 RepID=A0AAV7ICE2_COTGL|nr:hypothetical protein KQX54_016382 [Cotesia glomerata]